MFRSILFLAVLSSSCIPDRTFDPVKIIPNPVDTTDSTSGKVGRLRINEVVSGGSPDWFEIYNPGDTAFELKAGEIFFTDSYKTRGKYKLSLSYTLPAKGYMVVECATGGTNSEPGQIRSNTFSLSSAGEKVAVLKLQGTDTIFLDSVTFGADLLNGSYGRSPNGTGAWKLFTTPSKGQANP